MKNSDQVPETSNVDAFIDFLCDEENARGLQMVTTDLAQSVIVELVRRRMSAADLLRRVMHAHEPGKAFTMLFNAYCTQSFAKRHELLDAIMAVPVGRWGTTTHLELDVVASHFTTADDFEYLFTHHQEDILNDDHPIGLDICPDEYWMKRIRRYIEKRDWERAYDELRRASRGFFSGPKEERPLFGKADSVWYRFHASQATLHTLVQELFEVMVQRNVIAALRDDDAFTSMSAAVPLGQSRRPLSGKSPETFEGVPKGLPGAEFAALFCKEGIPDERTQRMIYAFSRESGMVLAIAGYLAGRKKTRKSASRRSRVQRRVSDERPLR